MKTWLQWFGGLVLLGLAYLAIIHFGLLPRPTAAQRQALAALEAPRSKLGERDGFPVIWTSLYDVPEDQVQRITDDDVAAWNAHATATPRTTETFTSAAKGRFAVLPHPTFPARDPHLCHSWTSGCLAMVKADPDAVQAALDRVQLFAAHAARLAAADHVRYPMVPALDSPIPNINGFVEVGITPPALRAARGDPAGALSELCRDATLWRRLRAHTDSLIVDMVGVAHLSAAAQLAGDLLAELPPESAWPEDCATAFAALTPPDFDQCAELLNEARTSIGLVDHLDRATLTIAGVANNDLIGTLSVLGLNRNHARHKIAGAFAGACDEAARRAHAAHQPTPPVPAAERNCSPFEIVFDPTGCMLFLVATPDFSGYSERVADLDGRYAALRTAVWLRGQRGDAAALVDGRPPDLITRHDLAVDPVARTLTLTALEQNGGPERRAWSIPFRLAGETLEAH